MLDDDLREAVVGEFEVPIFSDQQVFWFQLAIDEPVAVEDAHPDYYFCQDAADGRLCEGDFLLAEVEVKIALGEVLHDDVNARLVLEGFADAHQEVLAADALHQLALQHVELSDL